MLKENVKGYRGVAAICKNSKTFIACTKCLLGVKKKTPLLHYRVLEDNIPYLPLPSWYVSGWKSLLPLTHNACFNIRSAPRVFSRRRLMKGGENMQCHLREPYSEVPGRSVQGHFVLRLSGHSFSLIYVYIWPWSWTRIDYSFNCVSLPVCMRPLPREPKYMEHKYVQRRLWGFR